MGRQSRPPTFALRLSGAFTLLLLLSMPSWSNEDDEQRLARDIDRSKSEATALLAQVIADNPVKQHPCFLADKWSGRTVDVSLARRYLGSRLHADLAAPHTATSPADVIDPKGTMRDWFCSQTKADATWDRAQAAFRSGASNAYVDSDFKEPTIRFSRVEIAFPVFDPEFATAVVVVSAMTQMAAQSATAKRYRPEGAGHSLVYKRNGNAWTRVHVQLDYTLN